MSNSRQHAAEARHRGDVARAIVLPMSRRFSAACW